MPEYEISVIVPCLNEEDTIPLLLDALAKQSLANTKFEIIVADGLSTDSTRDQIEKFQQISHFPHTRIIDNPSSSIPKGLNLAIFAAKAEIILRLDAHSVPGPEYLEMSLRDLRAEKGWNVGGRWDVSPGNNSWISRSIAVAAAHPFGVGDAHYRYSEKAQLVDTVPFGCFRKQLIQEIGPFDETLQANEDYEFNARIRVAGGKIWFNPAIRAIYFARANLGELARQYWRYGYWKWRMLRRFPATLRWRQALPPLFVLGLLAGPILASQWSWSNLTLKIAMVLYASLLALTGLQSSLKKRDLKLLLGVPSAIFTMHISYGAAFLWSMLRGLNSGSRPLA